MIITTSSWLQPFTMSSLTSPPKPFIPMPVPHPRNNLVAPNWPTDPVQTSIWVSQYRHNGKKSLAGASRRRLDNVETGSEGVDWIQLA
jgi:hypothetical protein